MKTLSLITILIGVLSFSTYENELVTGKALPEISLPDLENNTVELSSLQGKVVLVTFWASWCKYCKNDINSTLIPLYEKYKDEGFEIYSISLDTDGKKWCEYLSNKQIGWINVIDSDGFKSETARKFGIDRVPQNFLVNADGSLAAKDISATELENELKKLFN